MKITTPGARIRAFAAAGSVAAALVLTGCSSSEPAPTPEETTDSGAVSSSSDDLAERVAASLEVRDSYDMPSDAVDATVIAGKTIHYIPITNKAPQFFLTGEVLADAVAVAGAQLQICDGEGNPTSVGTCVDNARNDANTAAIITDGFYYGMAKNSLDSAQAAGVPVIVSNQFADPANPASDTLGYVNAPGVEMFNEVMSWVALDSDGAGNVLFVKSADGPGTIGFVTEGLPQFEADCPECVYTEIESTTATQNQLESELSAKLLQDPNIGYVVPQFAQYLPIVIPATAGKGLQIGTGAATLGAVQAVQGGAVAAASGQSAPFGAWALVDSVIRINSGEPVFDYTLPTRLFTAENIADVDVSETAEKSGAWFGPTTFADDFKTLWGVK